MKLTARQRKFLQLASEKGGLCPWNMPKGSPWMKGNELRPLETENLVAYSEGLDSWIATPKGRVMLTNTL